MLGRVLAEALGASPSYVLHGEQGTVGGNEHVELPIRDDAYTRSMVKDSWHYRGVSAFSLGDPLTKTVITLRDHGERLEDLSGITY